MPGMLLTLHTGPVTTVDSARASRRRYSEKDLKLLFAQSYNECALPGCEERLAHPDWPTVLAEICHIYGFHPTSARYDPAMSDAARNAYPNLLLLCRNCHRKVDELYVDEYPADRLLDIKRSHEERRDRGEWCSPELIPKYVTQLAVALGIVVVSEAEKEPPAPPPPSQPSSPSQSDRRGKKIRVYELARELGLTNKEALNLCLDLGIGVKSHSSNIADAQADRARRKADQLGIRRDVSPPGFERRNRTA